MKHVLDSIQGPIGWCTALVLAALGLPLAAIAILVVRTFLVPLVVIGVVMMAVLAVCVPPRFRDWVGAEWRMPRH